MKSLGKQRILLLLLGVATASVIVFSQIFYFQAATYCQEKVKTEQENDQQTDSNASHISLPSSTISSAPHIELNQDLSFVLGALFESTTNEAAEMEVELPLNSLFHTLFRVIISPNAP